MSENRKAKEVLRRYPDLVDRNKEHEDADPYVLALAALESEGRLKLIEPGTCGANTGASSDR